MWLIVLFILHFSCFAHLEREIKNSPEKTMGTAITMHAVQKSNDEIAVQLLFDSGFLSHQVKKNLILARKAYQKEFYNSVKNMENILFNIKEPFEIHNLRSLMKRFGSFIKNLSINTDLKLKDSLRYVSKYCGKLKKLSIKCCCYKIDPKYVNNITHLNELHIHLIEISDKNALTKFMSNNKNLKVFSLEVQSSTVDIILPSNSEFSLNQLSYSVKCANFDNFKRFLKNQQSLEKLVIGNNLPDDLFSIQHINENEDENVSIKIKNLKQLEDKRNVTNAVGIKNSFEFITTLKAVSIYARELTFLRLHTLEIDNATFFDLKNLFVPLLKVFKIKKFPYCDGYFDDFMHSTNSVETFIIESVSNSGDILQIVEMLKFFSNLQKFALRHGRSLNSKYNMEDNERIAAKQPFYKIVIENGEVKISSYIFRNCEEIPLSLKTIFMDFKFKVFCFDDSTLRSQNISIFGRFRLPNILGNELESFKPSLGFYSNISGSSAIENAVFNNIKSLTIPDFPVDFNGGKVLKFITECMSLDFFQCKDIILISGMEKQSVREISVTGNQVSSFFEMFRQYRDSILTAKLTLPKVEIDFDQVKKIKNSNRELFDIVQSFEINDESGSNVLFGGFLELIKKFRNITSLKITTRDRSIDVFLNDFLPEMVCLRGLSINARTLRLTDRLNSIHENARSLQKLWINNEYVRQSKEFFEGHNSMVEVNGL